MSSSKEKITEREAASYFVLNIIRMVKRSWPTIYENFKEIFKEKFVIENEEMAIFDLTLAIIAQELQAVKNLFSKDQAERIRRWVLKCINTKDWGKYVINEIKKYEKRFQTEIQNIEKGGDPLSAISTRLAHRWLGKNIKNFEVEKKGKKTGIINPLLIMMITEVLITFVGIWKKFKDEFEIVEDNIM